MAPRADSERDVLTPTAAQEELGAVAHQLLAVDDRLRRLLEALPHAPDEDAIFEGLLPWDLATELRAVVECAANEQVRPAIHALERASRVTAEELHEDFHRGRR